VYKCVGKQRRTTSHYMCSEIEAFLFELAPFGSYVTMESMQTEQKPSRVFAGILSLAVIQFHIFFHVYHVLVAQRRVENTLWGAKSIFDSKSNVVGRTQGQMCASRHREFKRRVLALGLHDIVIHIVVSGLRYRPIHIIV